MPTININQTNASETAKGIVEEATQAQVNAGTDTGETGAQLFVAPSKFLAGILVKVLTGFVVGANIAIAATDTLAQALAKIQGQINARPNESATTIATVTNSTASKNPPVDADEVVGMDSANSFVLIKYSWTNIKAFLKTYFDTLYVDKTSVPCEFILSCSDLTTSLTTGTSKAYFRSPYAFTLTAVRAGVLTAATGATLLTVDINESGTSVLSTKLTFDASEKTTTTAATPAVISDSAIADDAEITIDIDAIGSTIAGAGLTVTLIGTHAV